MTQLQTAEGIAKSLMKGDFLEDTLEGQKLKKAFQTSRKNDFGAGKLKE